MALNRRTQNVPVSRSSSKRARSQDRSTNTSSAKKPRLSAAVVERITAQESALLNLPAEIRLLIYDFLVDFTGVVVVYAQHQLSKEINKDSIALLHVCQLMREEMQALFYRSQTFRFCSVPAIDNFLERIGRVFASEIRNIQITPWLGIRQDFLSSVPSIFRWLTGVERLTILHADKRFVAITSATITASAHPPGPPFIAQRWMRKADICQNTLTILKASERLASGKVYYLHDYYQPELQLVPSNVVFEGAQSIDSAFVVDADTIIELEIPNLSADVTLHSGS